MLPSDLSAEELRRPLICFMPELKHKSRHGAWTWWHISPEVYVRYLHLKGFEVRSHTQQRYRHRSGEYEIFTLVAERLESALTQA
jgi:hypothetical protein